MCVCVCVCVCVPSETAHGQTGYPRRERRLPPRLLGVCWGGVGPGGQVTVSESTGRAAIESVRHHVECRLRLSLSLSLSTMLSVD